MKKKLVSLLKFVISLFLLWYVLSRTDLAAIGQSLKSVEWGWIFWAYILLNLGKFLTGYRWQRLLKAYGVDIPLLTLMASLYVGQFFNSFLPSTIGGDAIRAYDTANYSDETAKALTAVFLDRLIGMSALAFLGVLALIAGMLLQESVTQFLWLVLLAFAACVIALVVIFNSTLADRFDALLRRLGMAKIARKVDMAYTAVLSLKSQKGVLLNAFFLSILLQINVVLYYYFVGLSLDIGIPLIFFFIVIPIILVILLVPFSINGIGLREGAYVFFLGSLGAATEDAVALSWLAFGLILSQGLVGGVIFALRGMEIKKLRENVSLAQTENAVIKQ